MTDQKTDIAAAELDALWIKHGGSFHGPHVETATMPKAKWIVFMRCLRKQLDEALRDGQMLERTHRAIPDEFCFDPPDGGDVKPWEAAERMAQALASARLDLAQARAAAIEEAAALADISVSALEAARRIRALASRPVSEREGADAAPAPAISGGMVSVPRDLVNDLANELEAEVRTRYHWPAVHPANTRKYEGDLVTVNEARAALAAADHIADAGKMVAAPAISGGMVSVPREVVEFLCGAAPLDGVWFSERHPTETGAFWWRRRLRALAAADRSAAPTGLTQEDPA